MGKLMRHYIDPLIDCVFKAILGADANVNLLCNFLNSILSPRSPIVSVTINNPYNEPYGLLTMTS